MSKLIFLSDLDTNNFGYRQAITGAIKELGRRNATGKTVGQIGKRFGQKIWNATRGKVAGFKRGIGRIGRTFGGGNATPTIKANQSQINKRQTAINRFGVKNPAKPKIVSSPNLNLSGATPTVVNAQGRRTRQRITS